MIAKSPATVKIPKSIHQQMLEQIIRDGYGIRGKSKWVCEAIDRLLKLPDFHELVDIANEMLELTDIVSIRISPELLDKIDKAIIEVRKHYPAIEGVKSNIIRASIFQRLLRG